MTPGTSAPSPLSQRVVDRLAQGWDRRGQRGGAPAKPLPPVADGPTRRSFLASTAIIGSALVAAPARFLFRPGSAYAALTDVCGPDANCGGFTVFCCTVNGGVNQCPSGSIPGGWWRAGTGSTWCCGADRYYIDCQAACPPGCSCGTGSFCPGCQACTSSCYSGTSCDQRNVCRVQFRYGQCNEQIACTGNVLCRMVSCTPPWQIPALNCASSPDRTDASTAEHSAPCLQQASWNGGAAQVAAEHIVGSPSVAQVPGTTRVDVVVAGTNKQVYWKFNAGTGWSAWAWLGAPPPGFLATPSAVSWGPGNLNVFIWGADNRLWQTFSHDAGHTWSGWIKPLGDDGVLASAPAVCSWGPGRVDVFVIGTNGFVYHRWYDGGWNPAWEYRGAPPSALQFGALSVTSWAPGRFDLFGTAGNALWQTFFDGGWNGWFQPDNSSTFALMSAPSSASWAPGQLAVFGRGKDSALYWTTWFRQYWSGWQRIGNTWDVFTEAPAAGSAGCQQLDVFVRGTDGAVYAYSYAG